MKFCLLSSCALVGEHNKLSRGFVGHQMGLSRNLTLGEVKFRHVNVKMEMLTSVNFYNVSHSFKALFLILFKMYFCTQKYTLQSIFTIITVIIIIFNIILFAVQEQTKHRQ